MEISLPTVREAYARGANIMELLRQAGDTEVNSREAIEMAYDLQAGTYLESLRDPAAKARNDAYTRSIAEIFERLQFRSVLVGGVGEAITLVGVCTQMSRPLSGMMGFDISWSRLAYARRHLGAHGLSADLAVGDLTRIPFLTGSVDTVFTSHSIEPNRGSETAILKEMFRVARRYVVTLEPSNELGNLETQAHIEKHRYCRDLHRTAQDLGYHVIEHRLFETTKSSANQSALMIIEKPAAQEAESGLPGAPYACPLCDGRLSEVKGQLFCPHDGVVYPVLDGIPCLRKSHAILASKFDDGVTP